MRNICFVILLLFTGILLRAQSNKKRTPEEKAQYYTKELAEQVPIDSIQFRQIYEINLQVSNRFDSLYATKPDEIVRRKATGFILRSRDSSYRQILTKKQFLIYDDWQREKREMREKEKKDKENSSDNKN